METVVFIFPQSLHYCRPAVTSFTVWGRVGVSIDEEDISKAHFSLYIVWFSLQNKSIFKVLRGVIFIKW